MNLRLQPKMTHQLVMTPQLQQAIKLLQLSRDELEKLIEQSSIENPTLDVDNNNNTAEENPSSNKEEANYSDDNLEKKEPEPTAKPDEEEPWKTPEENPSDENDQEKLDAEWQDYTMQGAGKISEKSSGSNDEHFNPTEAFLAEKRTLKSHLEWQIDVANFLEVEKDIAYILVGYLNEEGYLTSSVVEIVDEHHDLINLLTSLPKDSLLQDKDIANSDIFFAKYLHKKDSSATPIVPDKDKTHLFVALETIIRKLQQLEPVGVFARSLKECLLLQIDAQTEPAPLVRDIIANHFELLAKQDSAKIAKKLKVSLEDILDAKEKICFLEPKPGRGYNSDSTVYVIPDVFVFKRDKKYIVKMNNENIPKLSINPYYRRLSDKMHQSYKTQKNKSDNMNVLTSQYLVEKIRAAEWLIKSIQQRQRTILRVSKSIVKRQQAFFEKGIEFLKPMVLKDIALDINVHESTVSRITVNKYMHTPRGIYELKFFFTSGIMQESGDFISSEKIKDLINRMIKQESANRPLTDSAIAIILENKMEIKVARRTVAKYREAMKIEPSNRRKRRF